MKLTFTIRGMSCANCAKTLERHVRQDKTVDEVSVTLDPPELVVNTTRPITASDIDRMLAGTQFTAKESKRYHRMVYGARKYLPLLVASSLVIVFAAGHAMYHGWSPHAFMQFLMAGYFLVFGSLKVVNWRGFVESYRAYDHLAGRSRVYAQAYPAIEVVIGALYYIGVAWWPLHMFVGLLMAQKAYSTWQVLRSGTVVRCACLGGFFAIPVTRFTVLEDLSMAAMAVLMLIHRM